MKAFEHLFKTEQLNIKTIQSSSICFSLPAVFSTLISFPEMLLRIDVENVVLNFENL